MTVRCAGGPGGTSASWFPYGHCGQHRGLEAAHARAGDDVVDGPGSHASAEVALSTAAGPYAERYGLPGRPTEIGRDGPAPEVPLIHVRPQLRQVALIDRRQGGGISLRGSGDRSRLSQRVRSLRLGCGDRTRTARLQRKVTASSVRSAGEPLRRERARSYGPGRASGAASDPSLSISPPVLRPAMVPATSDRRARSSMNPLPVRIAPRCGWWLIAAPSKGPDIVRSCARGRADPPHWKRPAVDRLRPQRLFEVRNARRVPRLLPADQSRDERFLGLRDGRAGCERAAQLP